MLYETFIICAIDVLEFEEMEDRSKYAEYRDNDLQQLALSGNSLAEEELALRYIRLVKICARPYFLAGGDSEDLIQEGMFGLLAAIREFDATKNASFKTYAELCIKNRLLSAIRSATRMKHAPLNDGVSLDEIHTDETSSHAAFFDEAFRRIPEEQVLARERADELHDTFMQCLSRLEKNVLLLYLDGLSYHEIGEKISRSEKSIDNTVQRIRRKLARSHDLGEISKS